MLPVTFPLLVILPYSSHLPTLAAHNYSFCYRVHSCRLSSPSQLFTTAFQGHLEHGARSPDAFPTFVRLRVVFYLRAWW